MVQPIKLKRSPTSDPTSLAFGEIALRDTSGAVKLFVGNNTPAVKELPDINGLVTKASPDSAADYTIIYDAAAGVNKKILLNQISGGGGAAQNLTLSVTQTAHGFAVGDVITVKNDGTYIKGDASDPNKANFAGIATTITDADNFVLTIKGFITTLSGLTAGTPYYLSATTPGALTATEPTTVGYVSLPVFQATSATSGLILTMRGVIITSFAPAIASVSDGQTLKYDTFQSSWINIIASIDRPTISVTGNIASVSSTFKTQYNLGSQDGVQYKLYSDSNLTTLLHDTGVLASGSSFNTMPYTTSGSTYYVIGRIRENKYSVFSSYSAATPFIATTGIINNVGLYIRDSSDAAASSDNPNTYNPSTAWYSSNGATWTVSQRLAISNFQGASLGTQILADGITSYTFNNGIIDGLGGATSVTSTMVADLGSTKAVTQLFWKSMAGNTPGGWSNNTYSNGIVLEYWNGSSWVTILTFPNTFSDTTGSGVNTYEPTFASISARYFRLRNPVAWIGATRFQLYEG